MIAAWSKEMLYVHDYPIKAVSSTPVGEHPRKNPFVLTPDVFDDLKIGVRENPFRVSCSIEVCQHKETRFFPCGVDKERYC